MAAASTILILGGSGVFGRLLARELLESTPAQLVLAGRDLRRLESARTLLRANGRVRPLVLDLRQPDALETAARGHLAVVCAAGPFQLFSPDLPAAAVSAGAHWLDLADAPGWVLPLLASAELAALARARGRSVLSGAPCVPALSGLLVRWARELLPGATNARIVLLIGNRGAKGAAAMSSAWSGAADDVRRITLLGRPCSALRVASPDTALLRRDLGLDAEFRVCFEWPPVSLLFALLARTARHLPLIARQHLARAVAFCAVPFGRWGTHQGWLWVELTDRHGRRARAALHGVGQRLAILPSAFALESLLAGQLPSGVLHPTTWLPQAEWLARLQARGVHAKRWSQPALIANPASSSPAGSPPPRGAA